MIDKNAAARVMATMRKVFPASGITLEQEKRFLPLIKRAQNEDAAFEAVDMMFNEGVRYPTGQDYRMALERVHQRIGMQEHLRQEPPAGMTFREWYATQGPEMQARVRRVFPSLDPEAWSA